VVAALFSGVAAVILVVAAFRKGYHLEKYIGEKQIRYLGYLMVSLGLIYLYFTFAEFLTEGYVLAEDTVPLMESLLLQSYAPLFWFFVVGGGIVPILLIAIPKTRMVKGAVVAASLVVVGMWVKRFLIIVPTLRQALLPSSTLSYSGSWVEFSITLAAAAAIPLALMLMFRVFPVLSVHEMEEASIGETRTELEPVVGWQVVEGEG
jgi:molybdopterin-containing oxidoreductase family membrane subunit